MLNQIETLKKTLLQGQLDLSNFRKIGLYDSRKARILEENISIWERNLTALRAMATTLHIKHVDTEQAIGQPIISLEYSHSTAPDVIEHWLTENQAYSLHTLIAGKDLLDCQAGFVAQVTLNTPTVQEDTMTTESTTTTITETPKPKTKRGPTGYLMFSADQRAVVKEELASELVGEAKLASQLVVKELAIRWKALEEEERDDWNSQAALVTLDASA